jgi:sugar-specific transcriptional regulator TrmB
MKTVASLEKFGLNEIEAAVFLFLTRQGAARAPQIQTALDLNKVAAYRALSALADKGLVTTSGDKRLQKYAAEPLQKLLVQYDRSIEEMHSARADLEQWVSELANQENQLYKERKIQVYEGAEGYRLWLEDRLKGDVTIIREFGHTLYWMDFAKPKEDGKRLVMEYMKKRAERGIELRSIFTNSRDLPTHAGTLKKYLKESRFLDMPSAPLLCLSIFGSKVGFYSGDKGHYRGVIIDDRFLAGMMTVIFDSLWDRSERV